MTYLYSNLLNLIYFNNIVVYVVSIFFGVGGSLRSFLIGRLVIFSKKKGKNCIRKIMKNVLLMLLLYPIAKKINADNS